MNFPFITFANKNSCHLSSYILRFSAANKQMKPTQDHYCLIHGNSLFNYSSRGSLFHQKMVSGLHLLDAQYFFVPIYVGFLRGGRRLPASASSD